MRRALVLLAVVAVAGCGPTADNSRAVPADVAATPKPSPTFAPEEATVTRIVDGDTVVTSAGTIRVVGFDTPERGQLCYREATDNAKALLPVGSTVTLTWPVGEKHPTDRYGRLLRYITTADGTDLGTAQIHAGLANARYDSRDGYDPHPYEGIYHQLDATHPNATTCAPVG